MYQYSKNQYCTMLIFLVSSVYFEMIHDESSTSKWGLINVIIKEICIGSDKSSCVIMDNVAQRYSITSRLGTKETIESGFPIIPFHLFSAKVFGNAVSSILFESFIHCLWGWYCVRSAATGKTIVDRLRFILILSRTHCTKALMLDLV